MTFSGFVDLQVNGYAGVDFSSPALTLEEIRATTSRLAARGTQAFCPTLITSSLEIYQRNLPLLASGMDLSECRGRLLGIHLEGPFISPLEGARGVHPRAFVRPPSCQELDILFEAARGRIRLLTVAPELPGAIELISHAIELGITVAIGHTLAEAGYIRSAVEAGASLSTHLGNGLPFQIHRHINPLWPQLAEPHLSAMLITDGHHLPPEFIRTVAAAKGNQTIIITSDSAPAAGLPPGDYPLFGTRVRLEPTGKLWDIEGGTLAGSSATMLDCMNYLAKLDLFTEAELWQVGRDNPLAAIGLSAADIAEMGKVTFSDGHFKIVSDESANLRE